MDVDIPSRFLSVILTEERDSNVPPSDSSVTSVVSVGKAFVPKARSAAALFPLVSTVVLEKNDRKPWFKKKKYEKEKFKLNDKEIWEVTKHLPKTLLAECTIEIHRTPLNRLRKVPQQLCFDAKVFPISAKPSRDAICDSTKYVDSILDTCCSKYDQHNGYDADEENGINNVFELIEAVYSDHDSDVETETECHFESQCTENASLDVFKKSKLLSKKHISVINVRSTPKSSFKCEHCPNEYPNRGALWQHRVATHSVEKNCECKICGRKFYRNCSLALHLKSHSEEKLSACKRCGKSFSKLLHLERHSKICGSSFALHSPSHIFKRSFVCTFCNKFFSQKGVFKKHLAIHVGDNLKCNTCGIEFTQRSSLLRHLKRMHCSEPVKQNVPVLQLAEDELSVSVAMPKRVDHDLVTQPLVNESDDVDCNYNNQKEGKDHKGGGFGFYVNMEEADNQFDNRY